MGDWNLEPKDLAQAGWLDTVNSKVFAPSAATCAGGAGAVIDYFMLSEATAHLVQQVEVVPHKPVSLTLTAASWCHMVLARRRPKPFSTEVPVGPQRQEEHFDWTGQQRISLSTWSWRGWSGCAQQKQHGAGSRPLWGPTQAFSGEEQGLVIEHVSLDQATRNDTRDAAVTKKAAAWRALRRLAAQVVGSLAAWRKGRTSQRTLQRSVNTLASISLPDLDPCNTGWDFPSQQALAHTLRKAATCGDWALQVKRVMVFIKSHTQQAVNAAAIDSARCWRQWEVCQCRQAQHMAFQRLASTTARSAGWPGRSCLLSKSNMVAALVGFAQSQRQAAGRAGGCGRACAKTFTRKGRRCGQDIQEHRWTGSRLHQPQGNLAAASRTASTFHRSAHGLRGKAGQTFVLVSHDGLRPKPSGGRPHDWPHWCPIASAVATSEATDTKVGERPRCGLLLGLATAQLGRTRSWWRQRRGSSRRLHCYWTWPNSMSMLGTTTSGKKVRKQFSNAPLGLMVRFIRRLAFSRGRQNAPRFLSGPFGPFFQVAAGPQKLPNSCWQLYWKQWPTGNSGHTPPDLQCCRRHFGARGGNPQDGASPHRRNGQAFGGRPQGARPSSFQRQSKVLIDGTDKLKQALLQQLEALGIDECDTARNVGADLQLGRRRRRSSRGGWQGQRSERSASGSCARPGLEWRCALGFRGSALHSDTAPIHQSRRGQSHIPAQPRTKRSHNDVGQRPGSGVKKHRSGLSTSRRQVILAWATGVWEGTPDLDTMQAALRGSLARLSHLKRPWCGATRTQRPPLCSRSCGWDGAPSRPGISLPTTARRSTSWQWRPRRWVFGWTRLPFCGPTALHTGTSPRVRSSGKPSGHSLVSGKLEGWSLWHRNVLVKLVSRGIWTQERLARLRGEDDGSCQLCN